MRFLVLIAILVPINALAKECGIASWYGTESGNRTANGERFTGRDMTAAHRTFPFGTRVVVSHKGKSVTVRINDRGPFVHGRILDLSKSAARKLGISGVGTVCILRAR